MKEIYKIYRKFAVPVILILLIFMGKAWGMDELIDKIEIGDIADWYNTINNFIPIVINEKIHIFKVPLLILTCLAVILYLCKPRMVLLEHKSFSANLSEADISELKKEYYVKRQKIDLCSSMPDVLKCIEKQDTIINRICEKKNCSIGYYGIAHTPFVFRAGFMVGDQAKVCLFHRTRKNDSVFEEWSDNSAGWDDTLQKTQEINSESDSKEMYVAIGTSFPVEENEIKSIAGNENHILIFETNNKGFDVIGSYDQAEHLKNQILKTIRDCAKKYGINKIHLMLATSVAFTFFLGMSFSPQHDPEIIVYHYENGKYSWGINMNKQGNDALVKIEDIA